VRRTVAQIIDLRREQLPADCFVFKHSTACPISARAAGIVKAHEFSLPLYWINVIEQRSLSNWVADEYEVTHASPQLLEIRGGKAVRVLSHGYIRSEEL
jgi:bacillithiol system protein YtxJ